MFFRILKRSSNLRAAGILLLASAGCLLAQNTGMNNSIPSVSDSWPTFNGDYSGRRYSTLTQINNTNVKSLKLAWAFQTHSVTLKSTPLEVDGILYFTVPDYVWALDAKTGEKIWEFRRPAEGDHLGQRGVAFYQGRIYFGTPDAHLICLDARDGKKIWDVTIADVKLDYYLSVAPLIVKGQVVIGYPAIHQTSRILSRRSTLNRSNPLADIHAAKPGSPAARTWPTIRP